ncbi:MAG: carbohydrate binding domain-containing protein, partial [Planctomycetota bacterium]
MKFLLVTIVMLSALPMQTKVAGQEKPAQVIADFEDKEFLEGKKTTHSASVTLVDDVPEEVGELSVKTAVAADAGAKSFFGAGFKIPQTDFTKFGEIRFWIKADFESGFNFQVSSGAGKTSVFPFSTAGSIGKWKLVTVPLSKFSKPPWANQPAEM